MSTPCEFNRPALLASREELQVIHAHIESIEKMIWWSNLPWYRKLVTPRPDPLLHGP